MLLKPITGKRDLLVLSQKVLLTTLLAASNCFFLLQTILPSACAAEQLMTITPSTTQANSEETITSEPQGQQFTIEKIRENSQGGNSENPSIHTNSLRPVKTEPAEKASQSSSFAAIGGEEKKSGLSDNGPLPPKIRQTDFECVSPDQQFKHIVWVQGAPAVRIAIRRVQAADWPDYATNKRDRASLGVLLEEKDYTIGEKGRQLELDLRSYLPNKFGHLLITATLVGQTTARYYPQICWCEFTNMALDAFDTGRVELLVSDLSNGKPLPGVQLKALPFLSDSAAESDKNGRATLDCKRNSRLTFWTATKGRDCCVLSHIRPCDWSSHVSDREWYVVSDRNVYQPGERAFITGWFRDTKYDEKGALHLTAPPPQQLTYTLFSPFNVMCLEGRVLSDKRGNFSFELPLPRGMAPGGAYLVIDKSSSRDLTTQLQQPISDSKSVSANIRDQKSGELGFYIKEFNNPEVQVNVYPAKVASLFAGQNAVLTCSVQDVSGRPLSGTPVVWTIVPHNAIYSPPGWPGFRFHSTNYLNIPNLQIGAEAAKEKTLGATTEASGKSSVRITFDNKEMLRPLRYDCQASVTDSTGKKWTGMSEIFVHPADTCVGIKMRRVATTSDELVDIKVIATDLDGKIRAGAKVDLEITERANIEVRKVEHRVVTITDEPAQFSYLPRRGTTTITCLARLKDSHDRPGQCSVDFSMENDLCTSYDDAYLPPTKTGSLTIVADKNIYVAGDTAQITIKSPFPHSDGILFLVRDKIISETPLSFDGPTKTVQIPLTDEYYPAVTVHGFLACGNEKSAEGEVKLRVPPLAKTLTVAANVHDVSALRGDTTTIDVSVKGAGGEAVPGCGVALEVVDASILAAGNYKWPDPVSVFYSDPFNKVFSSHSRSGPVSAEFSDFNMAVVAPKLGDPIPLRKEQFQPICNIVMPKGFAPLALRTQCVETNSNGKLVVPFKIPDYAAKFCIMVVAVDRSNRFGVNSSTFASK